MDITDILTIIETEPVKDIAVQRIRNELKHNVRLQITLDHCLYLFRPPMTKDSREQFPRTWYRYEILCQALAEAEPKFTKTGEFITSTKSRRPKKK